MIQNSESGQSLIEVLIALAASVAVVSAIVVTIITSLANAEFTKNQNLATQYSKEGLEILRQMAKNNWNDFYSFQNKNYCLDKGSTRPTPRVGETCGLNITDQKGNRVFDRLITIDQSYPKCQSSVYISSTVKWSDQKCQSISVLCHEVRLESCLSDINSIKSP